MWAWFADRVIAAVFMGVGVVLLFGAVGALYGVAPALALGGAGAVVWAAFVAATS